MLSSKEFKGQLIRVSILALILTSACGVCIWFWHHHQSALLSIATDPLSVPLFLAFLVLLQLLLTAARAVHEPQYAMLLIGRAQEIAYLHQWKAMLAPFVVLATLGIGYFREPWQLPLTVVGAGAAFFSIYGFVKDITGAWLRPVERESYFLLETKAPVSGQLQPTDTAIKSPEGYRQITPIWHGRSLQVPEASDWKQHNGFLTCARINLALQNPASDLSRKKLNVVKRPYKVPDNLQAYGETALIHTRAKGGLLHSEAKIRLCSDLEKLLRLDDASPVSIQKTSYYASVCSNELTKFEIIGRDAASKIGSDLFGFVRSSTTGVLIGFDDSQLSNHMGGGVLAITPEGKIILSKQGRLNVISPGLIVPSGSGSFDWNDQKSSAIDFHTLIKKGLERELMEECGLSAGDIEKTIVLGMGRDLARGGKPEFFGVTLLHRTEEKVQPKVTTTEIGFVDLHDDIELALGKPSDLCNQIENWLSKNRSRCSPTLIENLHLLTGAAPSIHEEVYAHLQR